jgi:hypothetical protein
VALVHNDDVPPSVLEVVSVLKVVLERINGDDRPVVKIERVVIARDVVA